MTAFVQVEPALRERSTRNPLSLVELSTQLTSTTVLADGFASVPEGAAGAGGGRVVVHAAAENAE